MSDEGYGYGDAERFGRHMARCSYCSINLDDWHEDRYCPEGIRLRDKVLNTPENRAYLLRTADKWFEEEWFERVERLADNEARVFSEGGPF